MNRIVTIAAAWAELEQGLPLPLLPEARGMMRATFYAAAAAVLGAIVERPPEAAVGRNKVLIKDDLVCAMSDEVSNFFGRVR